MSKQEDKLIPLQRHLLRDKTPVVLKTPKLGVCPAVFEFARTKWEWY